MDRSERGKLALTGPGAVEFLNGQVTNELADLRPGEGRYAAFLTHKGKMLGDLRILAVGRGEDGGPHNGPPAELLLDTERVALQALFDMIRRFKVGYDVELHKRTLERGLLSLIGPEARARSPRRAPLAPTPSTPTRRVEIDGIARAGDAHRRRHRPALRGRPQRRGARLRCASAARRRSARRQRRCLRVERGRPRYGVDLDESVDPPGGGAQRARGELHQGLLRRPGDGRASLLQGQAQPPSARPAPVRAGRARRGAASRRAAGRAAWAASSTLPGSARSRSRSCAARPRRATPSSVGGAGVERRGRRAALRSLSGATPAPCTEADSAGSAAAPSASSGGARRHPRGRRSCRCLRIAASCALTASGCGGVSSVLITFGASR